MKFESDKANKPQLLLMRLERALVHLLLTKTLIDKELEIVWSLCPSAANKVTMKIHCATENSPKY